MCSTFLCLRDKLFDKEEGDTEDEEGDGANVKSGAETHLIQGEAPSNQISENIFWDFLNQLNNKQTSLSFEKRQQ